MNAPLASLEKPDFAKIEKRAPSVARMFLDRVAATPHAEAFRYPQDHSWESVTWQQVGERVHHIAAGLISLGINPEDRVALASSTRYEWVLVDFAVMCAGAATTTVYPTTMAADVAYIVANSGSRVVVAENQTQLDKLLEHRAELPDVTKVVIIDGKGDGDWVITLDELEQLGKQLLADSPNAVEERVAAVGPDQLASLIYTSGTTGRPKGVRLTHGAWTYTAAAIDALNVLGPDDLNFLWLPLAHSFGKVMLALPLAIGFPTAIDGRVERIVDNLAVLHPTIMGAAPRIFEKAHARIEQMIAEQGRLKKTIFDWSIRVGLKVSAARQAGKKPSLVVVAGIQGGRPAGVLHHPGALRRPGTVLRLGGRRSGPQRRPVVRRCRDHRARGLWADRDSSGVIYQSPQRLSVRNGRLAIPGYRSQDRRRWRDPAPGTRCDDLVSRSARGHCRGTREGRLVSHRRYRRDRRGRVPADYRPQEGHVQDLAGQIRGAIGDRSADSKACART